MYIVSDDECDMCVCVCDLSKVNIGLDSSASDHSAAWHVTLLDKRRCLESDLYYRLVRADEIARVPLTNPFLLDVSFFAG